jgi:SAM-dependent methyltransferase
MTKTKHSNPFIEPPGSRGRQRLYPNEPLIRFVKSRLERDQDVLEIGCGDGGNLWMLASEGLNAHGIDIRKEAIKHTAETLNRYGVSATLTEASWYSTGYGDQRFDAVVDVVSMQHISIHESIRAISEVSRVLKNGGLFFSYRLGIASALFSKLLAAGAVMVDNSTVENIPPPLPLANNGVTSFWDADVANFVFDKSGLVIEGIERYEHTSSVGEHVEYLGITARKSC